MVRHVRKKRRRREIEKDREREGEKEKGWDWDKENKKSHNVIFILYYIFWNIKKLSFILFIHIYYIDNYNWDVCVCVVFYYIENAMMAWWRDG